MRSLLQYIRSFIKGQKTTAALALPGSLQLLIDASLDLICSIDKEGNFLSMNAASLEMLGYKPEEMIGKNIVDFLAEEDKLSSLQALKDQNTKPIIHNFENRYKRKDGGYVTILWSCRMDEEHNVSYGVGRNITEIKHKEKQLSAARIEAEQYAHKLSNILESLTDGFISVDNNWNITYWNRMAEEILSKKKAEVIGNNIWELYAQPCASESFSILRKAMEEAVVVNFEYYYKEPDTWFEVTGYPSDNGLSIYFKNINDRKKREIEQKIMNERFEFVTRATSDVIWDWEISTNQCFFSEAYTILFGHPSEIQDINLIWGEKIHLDDKERVLNKINKAIEDPGITVWDDEYRLYRASGSISYVTDRAIIVRNNEGRAVRMIGSIQDITTQKEHEQRIESNERKFKAMVQSGLDTIVLLNADFSVQYVSPNHGKVTGYNFDDMAAGLGPYCIHPDDKPYIVEVTKKIFTQKKVKFPPYRFKISSGEYRWFETTLTNFLDNEDIGAIVCNTRDITEKKVAEDELRKLSRVVEETGSPVMIMDKRTYITWVNKAFTELTGYELDDVIGKMPDEVLSGPDTCIETLNKLRTDLYQKQPVTCEMIGYKKNKQKYWAEMISQPILDEKGEIQNFFTIQTEITSKKKYLAY